MTIYEFLELVEKGIVVRCQTIQQRRDVLELFAENGFTISTSSRKYLPPENNEGTSFMHPSYVPWRENVSCYRNFERAAEEIVSGIEYEDIRSLIEDTSPLDGRSDAEFVSDFASLIC